MSENNLKLLFTISKTLSRIWFFKGKEMKGAKLMFLRTNWANKILKIFLL